MCFLSQVLRKGNFSKMPFDCWSYGHKIDVLFLFLLLSFGIKHFKFFAIVGYKG